MACTTERVVFIVPTSTPTPKPTPTPEIVHDIDIRAMLELLESNEVAAEAEYEGKLIRATGLVDDIERGQFRLLPLDSDELQASGMECALVKEQHSKILDLRKGDKVTISGRHRGFTRRIINTAQISDCRLLVTGQ